MWVGWVGRVGWGGEKGKEEGEEETWKWSVLWVMWCMGYGMFCMILFERLMTKSGMHGYHYILLSHHFLARFISIQLRAVSFFMSCEIWATYLHFSTCFFFSLQCFGAFAG